MATLLQPTEKVSLKNKKKRLKLKKALDIFPVSSTLLAVTKNQSMNNTLEQKRQNIERAVKIIVLCVVAFLVSPFIFATIKGLAGLAIAAVVALVMINVAPSAAALIATWRLKALKAVAAANPIETLQIAYNTRKESLIKQRDNIKARIAVASKIFSQITNFERQFNKPSPRRVPYEKLNQLIELSKSRYQNAQVALVDFGRVIEEKSADWEIVQSMNEANKLRQAGEDFTSKLMSDTALTTVQTGLDTAFAELDAAVMDENIEKLLSGQDVQISTVTVTAVKVDDVKKPVKALVAPSELDFEAEVVQVAEPVEARRRK
jgi:hypothetical protein